MVKSGIIFFSMLFCMALFTAGENLVTNPSFEYMDENGFPANWERPSAAWHESTESAYDGKCSILFDNSDTSASAWLVQSLKLQPGKTYEYSAYMKVVMKPDAPKNLEPITASIILEYTKDGIFAGGNYGCSKVSLNNEWVRISGRAVIPEIDSVTLGLLPNPRNSVYGKIWFDCIDIHEVEGIVFASLPVTDCYRDEATGGMVDVLVGLGNEKNNLPEESLKGSTLRILRNEEIIKELPVNEIRERSLVYQFDAGLLQPGTYTMQCHLVNRDNGKVYTSENIFKRLETTPDYRVYVDKNRRMIVDGKPYFPLGMYHKGITKENLQPYLASDFNCLIDYNPISTEMLDYIYDNGLRVLYANAYASSRSDDKAKTRERHEKGYKVIDELKFHPAILAWYINDELPVQFLQDAIEYRRGCEEHDPEHPTWTVLCNAGDFMTFLPASDIHGSDPYPIPGGNIGNAYVWARKSVEATLGTKAVIQVPQAFCWGRYWKRYGYAEDKVSACPMPTYEQMDAMAWMAIAGGANGLIFYSYFDILARDKENPGLPAIPFEKTFGDLKRVASRVKAHEEVLLSIDKPLPFKITSKPQDVVCLRAYCLNGVTWLLAVNSTEDKPGDFEVEFEESVTLEGLSLSEANVKANDRRLAASLKPLQVVFIQLRANHKD